MNRRETVTLSNWCHSVSYVAVPVVLVVLASCSSAPIERELALPTRYQPFNLIHTFNLPTPTSPVFSRDERLLFLGNDKLLHMTLVDPEELTVIEKPVELRPSVVVATHDGRLVFLVERSKVGNTKVGRTDLGTWSTSIIELPENHQITDVAVSPTGEQVYIGDLNSSALHVVNTDLFQGQDPEFRAKRSRTGTQVMFLPGGPAGGIEVLGNGTRLLILNAEENLTARQQKVGRLGAEMSLIESETGRLVDWYWSESGFGTSSISVSRTADGEVVFSVEDMGTVLAAYSFNAEKQRLASRPQTLARFPEREAEARLHAVSGRSQKARVEAPWIVESGANGEVVLIVRQGDSEGIVLELDVEGEALSVKNQSPLRAPHAIEEVAISENSRFIAAVSTTEGAISFFERLESTDEN